MNLLQLLTDINSLKVYSANILAIAIYDLTAVTEEIKLILLMLTGLFTLVKTIDIIIGWIKKNKHKEDV